MEKYRRKVLLESSILPAAFLMAIAYLVFLNTFGNSWTYDDFPVIVNNPDIRSIHLFLRNFYAGRIVRELSLSIDYYFFGLTPVGYHIQNIFWHGLNAGLIFFLVSRLGGSKTVAWTASLLFVVHPVQVEVVANISNRKDSLCLAFSLLSLLAYINSFHDSKRKWVWLAAALCLAYVAMQAKQNACVLPLIFLGYEKAFLAKEERLLLRKNWPWVLALATGIVGFFVWYLFIDGRNELLVQIHKRLTRVNFFLESSESVYYAMTLKSWAFMFTKLILPVKLSPDYIYPVPRHWYDIWVVFALIGLILYSLLLVYSIKRSSIAFFALVWLGAYWLPTANLWPSVTKYFAADRYLYAPSVGFCIISAMFITWIIKHPKPKVLVVLCLVLALSILTWRQNTVWHSSLSLFTHTEKFYPDSRAALDGLGRLHMRNGEYDQAIDFFSRSVKINPYFADPYVSLARAYENKGDKTKALEYYRKFIEMNPKHYRFKTMMIREHLKKKYGVTL
ncbi:MAG: tetratricopeptide repeat protein [Deltaproteobacteria bacterium]|jgi:tetratricopeptide (TPR) repeat protein|nr:tetratricopeptide repeat protein [Deltaproteobacteria bacterium]